MSTTNAALAVSSASLYMTPAFAQKAQDTLRIAIDDPFAVPSNDAAPTGTRGGSLIGNCISK